MPVLGTLINEKETVLLSRDGSGQTGGKDGASEDVVLFIGGGRSASVTGSIWS